MTPVPYRLHAAGKRRIRRRLGKPVTAPYPTPTGGSRVTTRCSRRGARAREDLAHSEVMGRVVGSTYTAIDVPNVGDGYTNVGGINDKGDIVGTYFPSDGPNRGLLLSGGTYTTISFPDSIQTYASGTNQLGQVVGYCVDTAGNDHGFLYSDGTYTTLDVPGGQSTQAYGINAQGEIVGTYSGGAFLATPVPEPASLISLASGLVIIFTATFLARGRMSGDRR